MFTFPTGQASEYVLTRPCIFTSNECLPDFRVSLAALGNHFQEIAGQHAAQLGVGITQLQEQGCTWFLRAFQIRIKRLPRWSEPLEVTTWPSNIKGRLIAIRDFLITDAEGNVLVEATSDWAYINLKNQRITKLPESIKTAIPYDGIYKLTFPKVEWDATLPVSSTGETCFNVRRHEIDANLHVNNNHYTQWALETLPESVYFTGTPDTYAIRYHLAALLGDKIRSTTYEGKDDTGSHYWHHIVNMTSSKVLATAYTHYATPITDEPSHV